MLTGSPLVMAHPAAGRRYRPPVAFAAVLTAVLALGAPGVFMALADPASPFSITNVDSPDPVSSGAELTYTITVVNTGGAKVHNVVLSDQLNGVGGIGVPPQLVLTSTRGSCAQNANLVTCSAGTIEGGGSWIVTIRGVVNAADGTTLNNTASVTGTKSAQNFTSTATANTLVTNGGGSSLPDLTISKTGPTSVPVSSPMTYTLTVNNIGTANATGVKVVDTVPAGLTGIVASGTSLFTCGVVGQTVTCTGGAVNQGSNATITINATSPAAEGSITNTASVDPDGTIAEVSELNNTAALVDTQVTSGPPPPALSIVKTDDPGVIVGAGPDPVTPGGQLTYKILVTNNAATRADDVVVVDGTQGLAAAGVSASQVITGGTVGNFGGCTVEAPQVRCSIRTLDPGGTMLVTITGQVVASAGSTIFNSATVTGNIRNQGFSSTATELTTVKPGIDLTVTKADSPDPVCARSWPGPVPVPLLGPPACLGGLTYTFVVGNSGINTAVGVLLRDPLPPGTVFDGAMAPAFAGGCAVDTENVLTCTDGTIAPESVTTVTILIVAPPTAGPISNTVTVDPNNAIFEADETNNTATQTTQVITGVDLTVLKVDGAPGFDPIATGGTQTYTITVDNLGTQDATGIRVRDTLPAGTTFRSAVGDNGFTCSHAAGVVECAGGAILGTASEFYAPFGAPGDDTATITIRVFARAFEGSGVNGMHNEVRVDPLNEIAEADEANNVDFEDTDVGSGGAGMGAFNQLTIAKAQTSPMNPVARNALVTYTITVGNDGTDPVVAVTVRDFLPAGSRYIEATGTNEFLCTEQVGFVDCTGGEIPAGGMATITVKLFAPDTPGTYTNQAIVDPANAIVEGNEFDNQAFVETMVQNGGNGPFNDLRIEKTGTATATPGGPISYTLQVLNVGSNPAPNVAVRDVLPAGTTFVSAEDSAPATPGAFTCSHSGGVVDCVGGTLAAGGVPRLISIEVTAPNQNVTLTNQALIDPDNAIPEGDEQNNTDTHDTLVQSVINLRITKTGPNTSSQSTVADYVITVQNQAPMGGTGQTAFGVEMHDPLPVGLIPLAVNAGTGNNWACQIAENPINVVDCVGDLNPGQEVTVTITVFMTAESGRSLDNEACVDPDDEIEEFDPPGEGDNCSTHSSAVGPPPKRSPDLLVNKGADLSSVTPGDSLTYTISISNIGTADALSPLTLTDNLPSDVTFVDATGSNGWTCTEALGTVTCNDTPGTGLAVGASAQITIHVTVNNTANLPIANTAVAAPALVDLTPGDTENETGPNIANNSSTVVTSVGGSGFDLAIASITDNPDPVNRAHQVTYTVVAVNGGTQAANDVHVAIDIPPTGVTLMGADGSNGFNCGDPVSNTIDCAGDLPGGGDTVITVTFVVLLGAPDDLTLTATIDPGSAFAEADEGNNSQTEVTTVSGDTCTASPCIDLVAAQLVESADPVTAGDTLTYDFVLVNVGDTPTSLNPDPAANQPVTFFDLFGDFTLGSRTSSNPAVTCVTNAATVPGANLLSDCFGNLGPGEGVTLTITVTTGAAGSVMASGTADPLGFIDEFLETNNTISETTTVDAP